MRVSGAVWFKHKYLTNLSVTPEDQIVAAIGGLAKTLTTGVALQLRNDRVDKLCKLQEILETRTNGNNECKVRHQCSRGQYHENHQDWWKVTTMTQQQFHGWHGNMTYFQGCWKGWIWILRADHHHSNPTVHVNQAELPNSKGKLWRPMCGTSVLKGAQ
jgi:hypothetical protein